MTSWETVVVNADIRTMDLANPRAEAISFSDGRILYVGNESLGRGRTGWVASRPLRTRAVVALSPIVET